MPQSRLITFLQWLDLHLGLTAVVGTDVAPDAPAPTYDSHGNQVAEWSVKIEYDALRDVLRVHWRQEAGPYHKAKVLTEEWAPTDVEDALAVVQRAVRILGARRLF